jgi:hypothetical protein
VRKSQSTTFNITFTYKFGRNADKVSTPKKKPANNTDDSGGMDQGF